MGSTKQTKEFINWLLFIFIYKFHDYTTKLYVYVQITRGVSLVNCIDRSRSQ